MNFSVISSKTHRCILYCKWVFYPGWFLITTWAFGKCCSAEQCRSPKLIQPIVQYHEVSFSQFTNSLKILHACFLNWWPLSVMMKPWCHRSPVALSSLQESQTTVVHRALQNDLSPWPLLALTWGFTVLSWPGDFADSQPVKGESLHSVAVS